MSNLFLRHFKNKITTAINIVKQKHIEYKIKKLIGTPKELASFLYERKFGNPINWDNPIEWNEKLRCLQFNTDTSIWTLLADKYLVRNYLQEKGYKDILVKLYGVWDKAKDINFDELPDSFVLKTNHGCGEVIIVKNKNCINLNKIRKTIDRYLKTPFGYETAEPHYLKIHPKIIAEELLITNNPLSSSIIDYKFYCFDGEPFICGVYFDRDFETLKTSSVFYDMKWNKHPEWKNPILKSLDIDIPQPQNFEKMKLICKTLCKDMPFCRLDFYEVNTSLYFGEFTFTPAACTGGSLNPTIFTKLGNMMTLKQYPTYNILP